jgi:hypothetical protein
VSPGPAHDADGSYGNCGGDQAACSGHEGFYHPSLGFSAAGLPASFTIGGWTFNCTWKTSGSWGSYEAGCW